MLVCHPPAPRLAMTPPMPVVPSHSRRGSPTFMTEDDDGVTEPCGFSVPVCGNGFAAPKSRLIYVSSAPDTRPAPHVARAPEWATMGRGGYATALVTLGDEDGEDGGTVIVRIQRRHDPEPVLLARAADRPTAEVVAHAATRDVHLRTRGAMRRWATTTLPDQEKYERWRTAVEATNESLTLKRAF